LKVGFIGLGHMGLPMATRLLRAGFGLTVFNRTPAKARELVSQGARLAATPGELTQAVEVVLASLGSVSASLEVFLGKSGVVESARAGQTLVDHSTVGVDTSLQIHQAAREKKAFFLDAPVSGGAQGAADGTLSVMVGGEPEAFERILPVLECLGSTIVQMGPSGAGTAAKLANQLLVGVHTLAAGEALLLAERLGVDGEKLIHVLQRSWGQSRMLERNAPRILAGQLGPSATPVRNLCKDLRLVLAVAQEASLTLPAASTANRVFKELEEQGQSESDIAAVWLALKNRAPG